MSKKSAKLGRPGDKAVATWVATCDDRMLAVAERGADRFNVKVMGIVELAREIIK